MEHGGIDISLIPLRRTRAVDSRHFSSFKIRAGVGPVRYQGP